MRSAYGLVIPEPDLTLACVGPGTPCGELMRRYWHPVCQSDQLTDLPRRVRILGEDLVVFRDGNGRAGLLFFRCSHRGASLEYGRVEKEGLRCCYHGWLYDVQGNILDMPAEPPRSTLKDKLNHPCYPVIEFGGVVFAYMGPLDKMPEFPKFDVWMREGGALKARVGPRTGGPVDCNWLQAQENLMDPMHTWWLHSLNSGPQFPTELYGIKPKVKYQDTEMGMRCSMPRELPDGRELEVIWEVLMPGTVHVLYSDDPENLEPARTQKARAVSFCIPVDDTHQRGCSIEWVPPGESYKQKQTREALGPAGRKDKSYEYTQRHPDDKEAVEGLGPIANHGLEHQASSDKGVIRFRKMIRKGIEDVRLGKDPKGVIRDPQKAAYVPTTQGSVVRERVRKP